MEIIEEINQKIVPILQAAGITPEDIVIVKDQLFKVVFFKLMAKAVGVLSSEDAKNLNEKIGSNAGQEERLRIFQEAAGQSEAVRQLVEEFMLHDFTEVAAKISDAFLKNATPQQKEKLDNLLLKT